MSSRTQITTAQFHDLVKGSRGFKLLTCGNPKTVKGQDRGYLTFILHLSPATLSGWNVCPMATAGCKAACLNTAGRGGIMGGHGILTADDVANGVRNTIQNARINRTRWFFSDRAAFMALLGREIRKAIRLAERNGLVPVFRLNGTSDIRWETIAFEGHANVMAAFPAVQFYDYTKLANRRNLPSNYALTFSLADGNGVHALQALRNGQNVAAVFRSPERSAAAVAQGFMGYPVCRGDDTDLRFLDPAGHVVALYAKGNAVTDTSGFVVD